MSSGAVQPIHHPPLPVQFLFLLRLYRSSSTRIRLHSCLRNCLLHASPLPNVSSPLTLSNCLLHCILTVWLCVWMTSNHLNCRYLPHLHCSFLHKLSSKGRNREEHKKKKQTRLSIWSTPHFLKVLKSFCESSNSQLFRY